MFPKTASTGFPAGTIRIIFLGVSNADTKSSRVVLPFTFISEVAPACSSFTFLHPGQTLQLKNYYQQYYKEDCAPLLETNHSVIIFLHCLNVM